MNLWVRSQDKECLTNISNIQYIYKNNMHGLGTYYDNLKILGTYKTKERALEVLDEIQNILKPIPILKENGGVYAFNNESLHIVNPTYFEVKSLDTYVYEMPEE